MKNLVKYISAFSLYILVPIITNYFLPSVLESNGIELFIRFIIEVLLCIYLIFLFKDEFKESFKLLKKDKYKMFLKGILYFIVLLIITALANVLIHLIVKDSSAYSEIFSNSSIIDEIFNLYPLYVLGLVFVTSPITETIIFRKIFKDTINNIWLCMIISSLFYSLFQIGYNFTSVYSLCAMVPYFIMNLMLIYSYKKTNNIYMPIYIVILYNLWSLIGNIFV